MAMRSENISFDQKSRPDRDVMTFRLINKPKNGSPAQEFRIKGGGFRTVPRPGSGKSFVARVEPNHREPEEPKTRQCVNQIAVSDACMHCIDRSMWRTLRRVTSRVES